LDTDDIQELATPTNKYFTDARARGAISLTVTGNSGASTYSSGTGVLNVPTYTLAGLGGITATFLSGTSGISYNSGTGVISYSGTVYTDASIRALLSGGTGISYNSTTGAISYSGTVYTDSSVRALISMTTTGTSGASTYNNTTGVINVPNYTLAGLGGISLTSLSGGTGITYNNTTGAISYSGTVYTDASVRALISASGAVSYNNTTGVISLTSGNLTEATSSVLTITGGTGAVLGSGTSIQVKQASTSVSGFLSSTDWNTFNGKASALSGTTNYVAKFTSGSGIGNSTLQEVSGNLGLGVTPSTWTAGGQNIEVGSAGNIIQGQASQIAVIQNATFNVGWKYSANGFASFALQTSGQHQWFTAPSGTAGNAITFTERLTIATTGLSTLTSSIASNCVFNSTDTNGGFITFQRSGTAYGYIGSAYHLLTPAGANTDLAISSNGAIVLGTGSSLVPRLSIASTGAATFSSNIGVGGGTPSIFTAYSIASFGSLSTTNNGITIASTTTGNGLIEFADGTTGSQAYRGYIQYAHTSDSLILGTNSSDRLTITSAGDVSINSAITANSIFNIKQRSTASYAGINIYSSSNETFLGLGNTGSICTIQANYNSSGGYVPLNFLAGGSECMRITTTYNLLVGTTTDNGEKLYVGGAIRATGTITANSDLILKKNLLKIENALEKVEQINGYTYEFKADDSKRHAGVIAQEIQTVLPEIVNKGNDGILGVEYGNISALLIEAIKEQQTQINELKALLNK